MLKEKELKEFVEQYTRIKLENEGINDHKVAEMMGMSVGRLKRRKSHANLSSKDVNVLHGITPEQFKQAEANGIPRQILSDRVSRYGWKLHDAMTIPVLDYGERRMKAPQTKEWDEWEVN